MHKTYQPIKIIKQNLIEQIAEKVAEISKLESLLAKQAEIIERCDFLLDMISSYSNDHHIVEKSNTMKATIREWKKENGDGKV